MALSFHSENINFDLAKKRRHKAWIQKCILHHRKKPGDIAIVFTSNAHLLRMNKSYLNHNHFTDVITFDYSENDLVSGDVFISIDQVRENAVLYKTGEENELRRVMVHGVLHLIGFDDGSEAERKVMRELENEALHLWLKEV